jgi:hypothetical protein
MKKQPLRKLNLNRETLVLLQAEQLDGVAGAATPALIIRTVVAVSAVFCFPQPAN